MWQALPLYELQLRHDVIAAGEKSGYQCTPHLMLYVLHEPLRREEGATHDLPAVRRVLLTSANLSAAPWGYQRASQHGDELEIRSFELGVCVQPDRPSELVEPLGSGEQAERARPPSVWAQAIPFHIERRVPCADPFVSRSLTYTEGKAEMGHLNY